MKLQTQAIICLFFLLGIFNLNAQTPQLLLHSEDGWDVPLSVKELAIHAVFLNDRCLTTYHISYETTANATSSGTFRFYLQTGQKPRRFAVKLASGWRDAEIVKRTTNEIDVVASPFFNENNLKQYLFEEEVFQISSTSRQEIIFTYEEKLDSDSKHYFYQLPISIQHPLDSFSIRLDGLLTKPIIESPAYQRMVFQENQGLFNTLFTANKFSGNQDLRLSIPRKSLIETHVGRGIISPDYFFYSTLAIQDSLKRPKPKSVCLIWDQSHSAGQKDVENELSLLTKYFESLGDFELRLITFTTQVEKDRTFNIKAGDWLEPKGIIRNLAYDGATNFGCLNLPNIHNDICIISTDGAATIGQKNLPLGKMPIIAIISNPQDKLVNPKHWALQTNGNVIILPKESLTESLQKLYNFPIQFLGSNYDTSAAKLVYPTEAQLIGSTFSFSGKLKGKRAFIDLKFKIGTKEITRSIDIQKHTHLHGHRIEDAWASAEIQHLLNRSKSRPNSLYRKFIIGLSRIYKIPTSQTRFSLLESVDDYKNEGLPIPQDLQLASRLQLNEESEHDPVKKKYGILLDSIALEYHTWYHRKFYADYQLGELNSIHLQDIYQTYSSLKEQALFQNEELDEITIIAEAHQKPKEKALTTLSFLPWDVDRKDIQRIKQANKGKSYAIYLKLKKKYLWMPGFYAEAAEVFWQKGMKGEALRVLSNLLEIEQNNTSWVKYISHTLLRMNMPEYAFPLFQRNFKARPNDPQSYRDLASCHAALGHHQQAVNLLAEALRRDWGKSYVGLKAILISELNHIISTSSQQLSIADIPDEIQESKPLDLRILVEWIGDHFPLDVWVIDPTHEKAYYGNKLTKTGGLFSDNKDNDYGIEQYLIKEAIEGKYDIKFDYTLPNTSFLFPPSATVSIFKNYGTNQERKTLHHIQLPSEETLVSAASTIFKVGNKQASARYHSIQLKEDIYDMVLTGNQQIITMNNKAVIQQDYDTEEQRVIFEVEEEGEFQFKDLALSPSGNYLVIWTDSLIQQPEASGNSFDEWAINEHLPVLKLSNLTSTLPDKTLVLPQPITYVGCKDEGSIFYTTREGIFQLSSDHTNAYLKWPFNSTAKNLSVFKHLLGYSDSEYIHIINTKNWNAKAKFPTKGNVHALAFTTDIIAYATYNAIYFRTYQGTVKEVKWHKHDEEPIIEKLALSPDGKLVAIHPLNSNQVIVLDTQTGERILSYYHTKTVKLLTFSNDGKQLASSSEANDVRIRKVSTLPSTVFDMSKQEASNFAIATEESRVYAVGKDGITTLSIGEKGKISYSPEKLAQDLPATPSYLKILPSKKKKWMIYAYDNNAGLALSQIIIKGNWSQREKLLSDWMHNYDFSHTSQLAIPDKQNIIAFDRGQSIQLLDMHKLLSYQASKDGDEARYFSQECIQELNNSSILKSISALTVSENGKYIAAREPEHIYIWNEDGKLLEIIEAPYANEILRFGNKGKSIFFEGENHHLMEWDWKNSRKIATYEGHRGAIISIDQNEDGQLLTASADHTIKLWDHTGKLITTFFGNSPTQVAFYKDQYVVSINAHSALKFWQLNKTE